MSRKSNPTIHVEWSHQKVTAVDVASGKVITRDTLLELSSTLGKSREVLVGVSRNLVFLKAVRLPKAAPEDLRKILEVQVGQIFPLPANQLTFDFYQTTDQSSDGMLTVVAAIRTEDLLQLKSQLQSVGWRAARILPVALGSSVAAREADALVLEKTANGLALDVIQAGVLRLSRLVASESDALCEAQRTLIAARIGSLPFVTVGDVSLANAKPLSQSPLAVLHEALPLHFELAEDRFQQERKQSASRTRIAGLMFIASLLAAVYVWADISDARAAQQKNEAKWTKQTAKLRKDRDAKLKVGAKNSAMATIIGAGFDTRQPLTDVSSAISDSLPEGAWLTGLTLERGKPVQMRGTAKTQADVTHFVDSLSTSNRFREVKLVFANTGKIEDIFVVQFSVTAVATGNLPMPLPMKKGAKSAKKSTTGGESSSEIKQ